MKKKRTLFCALVIAALALALCACASDVQEREDTGKTAAASLRGIGRFSLDIGALSCDDSARDEGLITVADGKQSLEVRCFDSRKNAEAAAPSFLSDYIDYDAMEFSGANPIGQTGISAETIHAENSKTAIDAYLIDVSDGLISVVLAYPAGQQPSEALTRALESLTIK